VYNINDLRGNLEGQKEKYLLQLAEDILMWAAFWDCRPGVLKFESEYKQIFSMKDGIFILEIEDGIDVTYFYSESLDDLING